VPRQGKIVLIVLDGVGIGALPDADKYGDEGANTLVHIAEKVRDFSLPNLAQLGLAALISMNLSSSQPNISGCYGKMMEASKGKDSTTGHWELTGIVTTEEFPVYPMGFPDEVLDSFLQETGCKGFLGNKPASGTEIISELGDEHIRTGFPIIYTSADSVFQIAAHEEVIPLDRLYEICSITRNKVMIGKHRVGRVIARPFQGVSGAYVRTPYRKDFAVEPPYPTLLDVLSDHNIETVGIGKIEDLFCGRGLKKSIHTKSNAEGIQSIIEQSSARNSGFIMANLVDFDMLYGHRQDVVGFAKALQEFDAALPAIQATLGAFDTLLLTADHGNDPADASTDHTRESVPLLVYTPEGKKNGYLGQSSTFADCAQTVCEYYGISAPPHFGGTSFYSQII